MVAAAGVGAAVLCYGRRMSDAATAPPLDSATVRVLVADSVEVAATLIESDDVVSAWDRPSLLEGMTVGALSAHLVRAAGSVLAYLDRTDPETVPDGELLTPVTYFHAAIDAPIHQRIKEVSAAEAEAGPSDVLAECRRVAEELRRRLPAEPPDRLVGALGGRMLTLDDFCRTRFIEVMIHIDDLAASVERETPPLDERGTGEIIAILVGIARRRHGDWPVIHALARAERADGDRVFPVL